MTKQCILKKVIEIYIIAEFLGKYNRIDEALVVYD